jgi:hypothetical protein
MPKASATLSLSMTRTAASAAVIVLGGALVRVAIIACTFQDVRRAWVTSGRGFHDAEYGIRYPKP